MQEQLPRRQLFVAQHFGISEGNDRNQIPNPRPYLNIVTLGIKSMLNLTIILVVPLLFRVLVAMCRDGFARSPRPSQHQRPILMRLKHCCAYRLFPAKAC